jgi:hypothetical protein
MDHGLYLGVVASRQGGAKNLVCYPKYARFLSSDRDDSALFSIIEINMPEKEKGIRVSNWVVDYIILSSIKAAMSSTIVWFIKGSH